ncbi:MAG: hypothetical protein JWR41_2322, partial [Modestobacter sp.]|nr:hypothetical protein [Modestobacter sp.]
TGHLSAGACVPLGHHDGVLSTPLIPSLGASR